MKLLKALGGYAVAAAMIIGLTPLQAPTTSWASTVSAPAHVTVADKSPIEAVRQAKARDTAGFARRLAILQKSEAMSNLLSGATEQTAQAYWELFAATSTDKSARAFVKRTRGKMFMVSGTSENAVITLVDAANNKNMHGPRLVGRQPGIRPQSLPRCWRGWVAAYAWFASEGAICGAVGVVNVAGGVVCGGVFFALGMLPDFNAPCRR